MERGMERTMERGTKMQKPCAVPYGTHGTHGTGACAHVRVRTHAPACAPLCGRAYVFSRSMRSMRSILNKNKEMECKDAFHTPFHARSIGLKVVE